MEARNLGKLCASTKQAYANTLIVIVCQSKKERVMKKLIGSEIATQMVHEVQFEFGKENKSFNFFAVFFFL